MNLIIGGTGQVGKLLVRQLQDAHTRFQVLAHTTESQAKLEAEGVS